MFSQDYDQGTMRMWYYNIIFGLEFLKKVNHIQMTMSLAVIPLRDRQMYVPQRLWESETGKLRKYSLRSKAFKKKAIKLMGFFLIKSYWIIFSCSIYTKLVLFVLYKIFQIYIDVMNCAQVQRSVIRCTIPHSIFIMQETCVTQHSSVQESDFSQSITIICWSSPRC